MLASLKMGQRRMRRRIAKIVGTFERSRKGDIVALLLLVVDVEARGEFENDAPPVGVMGAVDTSLALLKSEGRI